MLAAQASRAPPPSPKALASRFTGAVFGSVPVVNRFLSLAPSEARLAVIRAMGERTHTAPEAMALMQRVAAERQFGPWALRM